MKKMVVTLLAFCMCIGLCACGDKNTQTVDPKDWDPVAEATATLNQYLACETEEDLRAVYHSSYSDSDIKMIAEYWNEERASWGEDISKQYVRKIKQIDTYKDGDVFFYAEGFETKDGYRTPVDPLPATKLLFTTAIPSQSYSIMVLTIENGRYVIANVPNDEWQAYMADFSFCTCDLGTVLIPGDPCKGCDGAGYLAEQSNNDFENGFVIGNNHLINVFEQDPCPDCDGTGLENYTYGDCPDCGGKGYNKS